MPVLSTLGAATAKAWGFLQQAAGGAADLYFNYVTMLLTGNGTNGAQNNTFLDSSTNAFSITRNGNTTQGSFSPYGSLWSNYFDGDGDYLTAPSNAAFDLGSGNFTIEMWINPTALPAGRSPRLLQIGGDSNDLLLLEYDINNNKIKFGMGTGGGPTNIINYTGLPALAQWTHIAIVRSGTGTNQVKLYINGVNVSSGTYAGSMGTGGTVWISGIGWASTTTYNHTGYISNARIVKGTAVYSADFTPSTTPLTAVSGTSILTCQSNRFVDNSANNFAITPNGTPSVQRFSPFNPTASYSTATIGGSGYFDGSNSYLTAPDSSSWDFGTGDFTIECWAYPTSLPSAFMTMLSQWDGANGFSLRWSNTDGSIKLYNNATEIATTGSTVFKLNQWHHVVAVRSGTTVRIYVNGVGGSSVSSSSNFTGSGDPLYNGVLSDSIQPFYGYMASSRIVKGSAVYNPSSSTLTVPTSPLTAVSGTQLLLNYTNAGIPDSAMMNDLETVGNAQVSTSVKKYGTGSIAFDGTGDWLIPATNTSLYAFGTGNFTIEFWVNATSFTQYASLIDFRPASTNGYYPAIYFDNTSGTLVYHTNDAARITAGSNLSTGTWYHIAVCRSGTSTKMFINGTQTGSTYTDSNNYICGASRPIIGSNGYSTSYNFNGYIDDLRISNYARYTTNFTAPDAAFPTY